jgi:hypothetical protein
MPRLDEIATHLKVGYWSKPQRAADDVNFLVAEVRSLQQQLADVRSFTKTTGSVRNGLSDDVECVRGLQERVRFTESFETLQKQLAEAQQQIAALRLAAQEQP